MTVLEIKLIPDPVLRKKAEPVKVVTNDIISVLNDMTNVKLLQGSLSYSKLHNVLL